MSIPGSLTPLFSTGSSAAAGGYQVSRSLRFNSADSAYLSRTPGTASNRKTWTWAGWVKRGRLGIDPIFGLSSASISPGLGTEYIRFTSSDTIDWFAFHNGSSWTGRLTTSQVFRDPSAWMHIVYAVDLQNATSTDRLKLYVNGTIVTAFSTAAYPNTTDSTAINAAQLHELGRQSSGDYFDGYLADVHFIDGQALDPSSFTEVSATTGQLIPLAYSGSFGTNGFWLKFSDNSAATAATLGKDYSGNSNNWTPNNLSVTAGAGNDSLVDSPTSFGTDTYVGGEVRGNYATLNPLNSGGSGTPTLTNGNLDFSLAPSVGSIGTYSMGSIAVTTGKWYWEVMLTSNYLNASYFGLMRGADHNTYGSNEGVVYFGYNGNKGIDGVFTSYGSGYTNNEVIGVALNLDSGAVTFYKSNISQGSITLPSSTSGWKPYVANGASGGTQAGVINFGQRAFAYTAPSGFKALCDTNLGAPLVAKPNTVFDVVTRTFTGASASITSLAFAPDFLWFKRRNDAASHSLFDSVRGVSKRLLSNGTNDEITVTDALTSFDSSGFTLGVDSGSISVNGPSSGTGVVWAWDAGTSTVSNTAGSITSQVRANVSAGFSICTFTQPSSSSSFSWGHGLNVAPQLVIMKPRDTSGNWQVYHASTGAQYLWLNSTNAATGTGWSTVNSSIVTSTATLWQGSNVTTVAYCFSPVVGYSSFGSYTGNGSASDGPFVYTGFRPKWILVKRTDSADDWPLMDTVRTPANPQNAQLWPNFSNAEISPVASSRQWDALSNGFKLRGDNGAINASAGTYIYIAFAENPLQYARAR